MGASGVDGGTASQQHPLRLLSFPEAGEARTRRRPRVSKFATFPGAYVVADGDDLTEKQHFWNGFSWQVVSSPFLEAFKEHYRMGGWDLQKGSLPARGGINVLPDSELSVFLEESENPCR